MISHIGHDIIFCAEVYSKKVFDNNSLDAIIINFPDNYIPNIDENSFLLFVALVETGVPATESSAHILVKKFQDMKFVESYSK